MCFFMLSELAYVPLWPSTNPQKPTRVVNLPEKIWNILDWWGARPSYNIFRERIANIFESDLEDVFRSEILERMPEMVRLYLSSGCVPQKKIHHVLTQEWNRIVNDRNSTVILGNTFLYEIVQSVHGDVRLSRVELPSQSQWELFPKKWEYVWDAESQSISMYQETTPMVAGLLLAYHQSGGDTALLKKEMWVIEKMGARWCNAADAGTDDQELEFTKWHLEWCIAQNNENSWFGGLVHTDASYRTRYNSEKWAMQVFVQSRREREDNGYLAIEIPVWDIAKLLPTLCIFSWRSGDTGRLLIEWYIERFAHQ